jgi:hypothetical protein
MAELTLSLASLAGRSGRGVRVAVVDSGVHAAHPHIGGIAGGVAIDAGGGQGGDLVDRMGHGTAVAAAIREKAPEAELLAVKVFDRSLGTTAAALVEAIRWAANAEAALVNLSLGTANAAHEPALAAAVREAGVLGSIIVAASPQNGVTWLPGALPGVVAVELDWECPRDACRLTSGPDGSVRLRASGFPRPIPGVPPSQNERGQSFAVANATGLLALAIEGERISSWADLADRLRRFATIV